MTHLDCITHFVSEDILKDIRATEQDLWADFILFDH